MRVQLAVSDQPHAQSAAVRFAGLGRRPKLTALSWEEIRLALMLDIGSN
jgi:hypothetical protein